MNLSASFEATVGRPAPDGLTALEAFARRAGLPPASGVGQLPLCFPLHVDAEGPLAVLVWPTPDPGWPVPVVRMRGRWVELVAASVDDHLRQRLMRAELAGVLDESLEAETEARYVRGTRALTGLDPLAWTILKGGGTPMAYLERIHGHLGRGDLTSALVGAERMCERYPGWSELHAVRWQVLTEAGRPEEAAEAATAAMALPMWTLGRPFEPLARAMGWRDPIDASPFARRSSDPSSLPADRAAWAMDHASLTGGDWEDERPRLRSLYELAGLPGIATLVAGPRRADT